MVTNKDKRTSISISGRNKSRLDALKHPGQSYDGLLSELMNIWEKNLPKKEESKATD